MEVEPSLLAEAVPSDVDSLISTNDPDDMANEQTWPTEDEMSGVPTAEDGQPLPDASTGTTPKAVRRIPKGMSEYQASWIVDEDDEDDEERGNADEEVMGDEEKEEMEDMPDTEHDMDTDTKTVAFQDLDQEAEEEQ